MADRDWKPSRLDGAKKAACAFVDKLAGEEPMARVGVVGYDDRARTHCPLTTVLDRDALHHAIAHLRIGGFTNITAGLEAAEFLLKGANDVCQVVLLSDGHQNVGHKPAPVANRLKRHAIIECVGIGGKPTAVHEGLLKSIASCHPDGSKRYRWIGDPERLVRHFEELAGRITRA